MALAAFGTAPRAHAATPLRLGRPAPFSFERLTAHAESLARRPYAAATALPSDVLDRIDYETHGKIRFDTGNALFRDGPGAFPVTFFHLGRYFPTPVHMHLVETAAGDGFAREILYDPGYFDMPVDSPAKRLPAGAGFAGFRFQESRLGAAGARDWRSNDWVAFLGASYFRAIGALHQYGLSARGIALNVAVPGGPEEFPAFTHFYFEPPTDGSDSVTVYALLDGPSIAGAYRFDMRRDQAVVMDVECRLFLRRDVARLGIAPLTSMYWYSETLPTAADWRPEVHDSDGLALWRGNGERVWRPLNNPAKTTASAFADTRPRGFGLLQRDRVFDHYHDGVHYERRPSAWVEPIGDWGDGAVQLIEIPTDDEIHDNVVACWVPQAPAVAGARYALRYRLHWTDAESHPAPLARCVATRTGRGGQPGKPRPQGVRKFMVEFAGGPLAALPFGTRPELVLTATRGRFSYTFAEPVPNGVRGHWRAQFDHAAESDDAVDIRLFLRHGTQALSETWLHQYQPS